MKSQTPKGTVKKRLVTSNIRGKPVDKMTLFTKAGTNGPIASVYGNEIANRPLSASVTTERLAKVLQYVPPQTSTSSSTIFLLGCKI